MIHTVKCFGIVNKAEIYSFLELSCFFHDPANVGNLISGSSAFSKTILNIRKFKVHILNGREELPRVRGQGGDERNYPASEVRGDDERSYPTSEVRGGDERNYPTSEVRGGGREEIPHTPKPKAKGSSQEEQTHPRGQVR